MKQTKMFLLIINNCKCVDYIFYFFSQYFVIICIKTYYHEIMFFPVVQGETVKLRWIKFNDKRKKIDLMLKKFDAE